MKCTPFPKEQTIIGRPHRLCAAFRRLIFELNRCSSWWWMPIVSFSLGFARQHRVRPLLFALHPRKFRINWQKSNAPDNTIFARANFYINKLFRNRETFSFSHKYFSVQHLKLAILIFVYPIYTPKFFVSFFLFYLFSDLWFL